MELEHSFTVPVPQERAWEVLLDVEKVAPCMPGATLDSVDGDDIAGRIKVKVGPIAMTYAGKAHFTERDPAAHVVTMEAAGKETRGAGTASATVRSVLEDQGEATKVTVHTTLNVTGRPAQFGRGVMAEVGGKLIGIFASNLADMLAADGTEPNGTPAANVATQATADEAAAASEVSGAESDAPRPDQLKVPVEELDLPLRAYNGLRRDGIHTIGDLTGLTSEQLLAISNIGPASVAEIRQKLAGRGLALSGEQPEPVASPGSPSDEPASAGPAENGRASANGHTPAASAPVASTPPASTPSAPSGTPTWASSDDDDAVDLLSVAGLPVLKRVVPAAAAALVLALLVALGLRRRKRAR